MQTEVLWERIKSLPLNRLIEIETLVDSFEQTANGTHVDARQARRAAVAAFAAEYAGTEFDLDEEFEQAGIEHWLAREGEEQ